MEDNNLVRHAMVELEAAGLTRPDSDYNGMLATATLDLIRLFASQGHSGMSAGMVTSLFGKLARYEPLCPLTGDDSEWRDVGDGMDQNIRCGRIFRANGVAHDIEGIVWQEPDGGRYTNRSSHVAVTFPYTPATVYRPSSEDPTRQ